MPRKEIKEKRINVRMTNRRHADLTAWAQRHEMSLSEAVEYLVDVGIEAEREPKATRADIDNINTQLKLFKTEYEKSNLMLMQTIKDQPLQVLEAPKKSFLDKFKRKKL